MLRKQIKHENWRSRRKRGHKLPPLFFSGEIFSNSSHSVSLKKVTRSFMRLQKHYSPVNHKAQVS